MGSCHIDHSLSDVENKLQEQKPFLPHRVANGVDAKLTVDLSQEALNDIFHLLKKYDLASETEREKRERGLAVYL